MYKTFPKLNPLILAAAFTGFLILIGSGLKFGPSTAPNVTFTTITGKKIALKALRGKPVIVTFWATDCTPCVKEIPHLIELYRRHHDLGLEIIAVAMVYDPPSHVVSMTRDQRLPYDVVLDLSAGHARAFDDVNLTPTTFVIGPEGNIVEHTIGAFDPAKMNALIELILKRKG